MMSAARKYTPDDKSSKKKGRANSIDEYVGGRLRQRRSLLGLSQEKLAEAVGITFQQIQKYENGANRVSASRLYQLSNILNVPVSFFFDNFETSESSQGSSFSDQSQDGFSGQEDIMKRKETLELIRTYYSVKNEKKRKDLLKLLKSMAQNLTE